MEKLIKAVEKRPPIWNKSDKNHHNNYVLKSLWEEVSKECSFSVPQAKGKWKRLRETFGAKFSTLSKKQSGDAVENIEDIKWPHFTNLMFLMNQFISRKTVNSLTEESNSSEILDNESTNGDTKEFAKQIKLISSASAEPTSTSSRSDLSINSTIKKKRLQTMEVRGQEFLDEENKKVENSKEKKKKIEIEMDEDISFFNSLLPHVRSLTAQQKLRFRIKVMQLLEEKN